jgi:hypothetical protein
MNQLSSNNKFHHSLSFIFYLLCFLLFFCQATKELELTKNIERCLCMPRATEQGVFDNFEAVNDCKFIECFAVF